MFWSRRIIEKIFATLGTVLIFQDMACMVAIRFLTHACLFGVKMESNLKKLDVMLLVILFPNIEYSPSTDKPLKISCTHKPGDHCEYNFN